jgi:hypothetical protein
LVLWLSNIASAAIVLVAVGLSAMRTWRESARTGSPLALLPGLTVGGLLALSCQSLVGPHAVSNFLLGRRS